MTPVELTLLLLAALVGIVLSALFSGMETGLYTINRVRLTLRRSEGDLAASRLGALVDRPARMLAAVLLGTNLASALVSTALATVLGSSGLSEAWVVVVNTVILVPIILVLCEILPKDLFRVHGDRWCYALAGPMEWARRLLTWIGLVPLVEMVGRWATAMAGGDLGSRAISARQRMGDLLKEGTRGGVISEDQVRLLDRALQMRDRRVADEMIPFAQVRTMPISAGAEARAASLDSPWTRLPLIDDAGRVQGAVSVIDVALHPDASLTSLAREVLRFDEGEPAATALMRLRRGEAVMGIVERGPEPVGLVTAKDLVEALTGELAAW